MLEVCLTLLLAGHLIAVNVGAAGPLVCVWLHRRCYRHGDIAAGQAGKSLAITSIKLTSLGVVLGLGMLALVWPSGDEPYFAVAAQFPVARYLWLLAEFVFFYLMMIAYVLLWERMGNHRIWLGLLAVLASTDLLYHFPPMMAMIALIPTRADLIDVVIDREMYLRLMVDPEIIAHTLHFWLASLAMAGAALMVQGLRSLRVAESRVDGQRIAVWGARIALVPTLLELPVGVWVFLELPSAASDALLGGDWLASLLMGASTLCALGLMHHLAAVAMGDATPRALRGALILMVLVVVLMAATLRQSRFRATAPRSDPPADRVARDAFPRT